MPRNTIGLVWVVGLILAAGSYVVGPDRFLRVAFRGLRDVQDAFEAVLGAFTVNGFELIRALAIGLFVVFLVLGLLAVRRGLRARAALAVVTVLYLAMLWPALDGAYVLSSHWFGAFLLAAVGAVTMTRRLLAAPSPRIGLPARRDTDDPWATRRR